METPQTEHSSKSDGSFKACCLDTLDRLFANNSMMFCPSCKCKIKTFADESAFKNYVTFCKSRRRKIATGVYRDKNTVTFKSYD